MSAVKYRQALDLSRRFHGEEHPFTGWNYLLLGKAHAEAGQLTTALEEMRQGIAVLDRMLDHQNPGTLQRRWRIRTCSMRQAPTRRRRA
jgi:hypothetical protein